jgi:acyl-coenzyme A synthetase/AMP-(fatty) acid ligase
VYRAWGERFGLEILDGIGATETIFMVLSSRAGASRPGTTGGPVPGSEVRLLDADGRPVAPGQQGVLWVKTPSVAAGYWGRPDDTRRAFDDGWFRFGDVYYVDGAGHWVHCGRQDDLFKVAGQWVIPSDVEAVALRHPDVVEAGLVGAEEGSGLIKPFLFVVLRPDAGDVTRLTAELTDRLAREVPTYARPARGARGAGAAAHHHRQAPAPQAAGIPDMTPGARHRWTTTGALERGGPGRHRVLPPLLRVV